MVGYSAATGIGVGANVVSGVVVVVVIPVIIVCLSLLIDVDTVINGGRDGVNGFGDFYCICDTCFLCKNREPFYVP
ncbi:Hypothetical predicted protein [Octopus vulgaris]|uniref:Transmembrane protein n=1 Tax=Octopus vulgaris TaxID=6645 RepID=A0AA36FJ70_OCTVU|nr:Hypothetical predicted protein [Octopus vulgaris]